MSCTQGHLPEVAPATGPWSRVMTNAARYRRLTWLLLSVLRAAVCADGGHQPGGHHAGGLCGGQARAQVDHRPLLPRPRRCPRPHGPHRCAMPCLSLSSLRHCMREVLQVWLLPVNAMAGAHGMGLCQCEVTVLGHGPELRDGSAACYGPSITGLSCRWVSPRIFRVLYVVFPSAPREDSERCCLWSAQGGRSSSSGR